MIPQPDLFLSDILGEPVYNLTLDVPSADKLAEVQKNLVQKHLSSFVLSVRVQPEETEKHAVLSQCGFFLADINTLFSGKVICQHIPDIEVTPAFPEDEAEVVRIAQQAFRYSRFHRDPHISSNKANRIKSVWAANYFKGKRGDNMLVARISEQIAGFCQLIYKADHTVIDLIAVDAQMQGKGAGRAMMSAIVKVLKRDSLVKVGTQLCNTGSVALYQKMGLLLESSQCIFHYHHLNVEKADL